ncbi:unannotated protein [freshwater metagenome]|uniref:Unannotated protein n=1 Tax=freshwater metagenome TaxID=449393 RepID=A0A6J6DA51_9ZZZZ
MSSNREITFRLTGETFQLPKYRILWMTRILYSSAFEVFIAFVIFTNAIALAVLTFSELSPSVSQSAHFIDQVAFGIYVVELVFRIVSYGTKPWMFFRSGWNVFDFLVIALVPVLEGQTALLRLLRLMRLLRILRFLPDVKILVASIVKSIPPLLSMTVVISLLLFVYGMAGTYLFGAGAPTSWGDIGASFKSLFILLTLENFPVYLEEAMAISPFAIPFFVSYVFIIVFTVLNILIGVVLHSMDQARDEANESSNDSTELRNYSNSIEAALADGKISQEEANRLLEQLEAVRSALKESGSFRELP